MMGVRRTTTQMVGAAEARQRLGPLFDQVVRREARVIVEEGGVPVAAIVSAEDLARLDRLDAEQEERLDVLARMRAPFEGIPEEQIVREVAAVIAEVRAEAANEEKHAPDRHTA